MILSVSVCNETERCSGLLIHLTPVSDLRHPYLVVVGDTAVGCGGHDLGGGGPQVTGAHDARLGDSQTQDQVIPPERHVAVGLSCRARLFGVHGTTAAGRNKQINKHLQNQMSGHVVSF